MGYISLVVKRDIERVGEGTMKSIETIFRGAVILGSLKEPLKKMMTEADGS